MTHRFVHLGDLHLGPNSRNGDRIAALDQVIAENINQPVAAWLFPGDLNHGRMTIEDKNTLVSRVTRMANHAPVVIVYGNHDLPGDLDFLAALMAVWPIVVVARPQVVMVPLAPKGTAAIFCLPYPQRAGLVSVGVQSDQLVDSARQALDVIFMSAADELQRATADGCVPLMIGHVNVGGAISSSGQPQIGKEIELDPILLDRLGRIYKGLNHIHKRQFLLSAGAHYAGSMCRLDYGEVEPKGYIEITYGPGKSWGGYAGDGPEDGEPNGWAYDTRYRVLDVAPMYRVSGTLTRDGFDWQVVRGPGDSTDPPPTSFAGCEVKVSYRFNANEKTALDEAIVRAPFEGAKRLELDPIGIRERASRAPDVAAATTLEAKVEAFVRRSSLVWGEGVERKLAALQSPDGAAFLTQVQRSVSGPQPPASLSPAAVTATDLPAGPDARQEVGAL